MGSDKHELVQPNICKEQVAAFCKLEPSYTPKTYEDGLREAFKSACLIACADCRYGLEKKGFFGHCDGSANEWDACWPLRRAAKEFGMELEEK